MIARRSALTVCLAFLLTCSSREAAAAPILDITTFSSTDLTNSNITWGWSFRTTASFLVDALGVYDANPVGLSQSHAVGLWTSTGTLLTSATVDNTGTPVAEIGGRWLFASVTPFVIAPGDYVLGASYSSAAGGDARVSLATVTTIPNVTFLTPRLAGGVGLNFPDVGSGTGQYFGPNLSATAVPEPTSIALLGSGVVAIAIRARRRR